VLGRKFLLVERGIKDTISKGDKLWRGRLYDLPFLFTVSSNNITQRINVHSSNVVATLDATNTINTTIHLADNKQYTETTTTTTTTTLKVGKSATPSSVLSLTASGRVGRYEDIILEYCCQSLKKLYFFQCIAVFHVLSLPVS
jgi:hypothetical protein